MGDWEWVIIEEYWVMDGLWLVKIDERRLTVVCDIQLVMGNQLLVWSEKRLVLGNGWSMVSDRFIGNELLVNVDLSLVSGKSRKWWVISDGGWGCGKDD